MNVAILILTTALGVTPERPTDKLQVDSALLTLIEQVEISAADTGTLAAVTVREGQMVEEGTVLARIDDAEVQIAKSRAQVELDIATKQATNDSKVRSAQKTLDVTKLESKRAVEAADKFKKSVSQTEIDELRLASERAAADVEQAEQELAVAQLTTRLKENELQAAQRNIDRRQIRSPIAGEVVQVKRHRGEWVQPGETIVRIVRMDRLRAEGFINAHQVAGDLTGAPVKLVVDLPGRPKAEFPGVVAFVNPEVNAVSGQTRFWAEIENRDLLLKSGLQGTLTVDLVAPRKPRTVTAATADH